jgi:hypothetical protein
MPDILNDPDHWLQRASEARAIAGQLTDEKARLTMLGIARGYERLATRAEERSALNQRFTAVDYEIHVVGDDIIVNLPGTRFTITYWRTTDRRGLEEKPGWARDDGGTSFSMAEFRAEAWQAASKRARELGWIV